VREQIVNGDACLDLPVLETRTHSSLTTFYEYRPNISSGTAGIRTPPVSPPSQTMDQRISGKTTEPIPANSPNSPILSPRSSFVVVHAQAPDKLFCSTLPTSPGSNRPWEVTKGVDELYSEVINHRSGRGPRERLVLRVPLDKFKELRKRLEEYPGRLRYNYDYMNEKIISFPNPSAVHESTTKFFREIMASKMSSNLAQINSGLVWAHWGSQTTRLTSNGKKTHDKGADEAYYVRSGELDVIPLFPAFVIEVGHSETIEELLEDAAHWLCQSQGHVLAVLVVKFNKPTCEENFHDITKWQAWMQIYVQRYVRDDLNHLLFDKQVFLQPERS